MFIHEFKSTNCIITKIVISGPYITVYTNKAGAQELNSMIRALGLSSIISGDHPLHEFCHNPYVEFSAMGDLIPHKHLQFPDNVERVAYLEKIFDWLLHRQRNKQFRVQDYDTFVRHLNEERISYGHLSFPQSIQKAIDEYDIETLYVPEDEIPGFLNAFNQHVNNPYNMAVEKINLCAKELLYENWKIIYDKYFIGFEEISDTENNLCNYFSSLLDLRKLLLAINSNSTKFDLYHKANNVIKEIIRNPNFSSTSTFSHDLSYIMNHINNQINSAEFYQQLSLCLIGSVFSIGYLLLTEDSSVKAIVLGLAISSLATLGTKYLARPLTNSLQHTFFKEEKHSNHNEDTIMVNGNTFNELRRLPN